MDKIGPVLRNIVFFLFPIPFLLDFAVSRRADWPGWLAYAAVAVLLLAAIAAGIIALRRGN
jgi:hypothetical protein